MLAAMAGATSIPLPKTEPMYKKTPSLSLILFLRERGSALNGQHESPTYLADN